MKKLSLFVPFLFVLFSCQKEPIHILSEESCFHRVNDVVSGVTYEEEIQGGQMYIKISKEHIKVKPYAQLNTIWESPITGARGKDCSNEEHLSAIYFGKDGFQVEANIWPTVVVFYILNEETGQVREMNFTR